MSDDLNAPLGLKSNKTEWRRLPFGLVGFILLVLGVAGTVVWTAFFPDPLGGEPSAVVRIDQGRTGVGPKDIAVVDPSKANPPEPGASRGPATLTEAQPPAGDGPALTPMEAGRRPGIPTEGQTLSSTPVSRVMERGRFGPLPRIGGDGARPLEVYSRPVPKRPTATPKVVVVVGGLGLSQTGTQEAIRLLPPDVTFAFAPYGSSLDRWMQRARQQGHEILLQLPMEPFDFPDNDPGPHTLLTGLSAEQNIERLHWVMSRLTNYVGVINYMGAKLTADETKLQPLLRELSARGVMYMDDGSSGRSTAETVARTVKLPFAKADMIIDSVANEAAIDARLQQLENLARSRGIAVGMASALPVTVKKLSEWAKTLEGRGIVIVPASVAAREGPSG